MVIMRNALSLLTIILFSLSAMAISLDDVMATKTSEEISPVSIGGKNFFAASFKYPEKQENAARICAALGYTLLVSYQTEACTDKEVLLGYDNSAKLNSGLLAGTTAFRTVQATCGPDANITINSRFSRITCAK